MVFIYINHFRSDISRKMSTKRTENNVKNRFNSLIKIEKYNNYNNSNDTEKSMI